MPCYHPLRAFPIGLTNAGKTSYKIVPYATHHLELQRGTWIPCDLPFRSSLAEKTIRRDKSIEIPCGKCIGCRIDHSRQWANRCMLELQYHKSSYFITLTYDQDHVPISYYAGDNDEAQEIYTLDKRDFQNFMKRLRKNTGQELRFFMCGEYGSQTFRPHYHVIVFGLELDDLEPTGKSMEGFQYFRSRTVERSWMSHSRDRPNDPKSLIGMVCVAPVTWETCAYTARYIMKKLDGPLAEFYADHNIQPEFSLMSRRPGIARQYYDDHPELYQFDYVSISTSSGGRNVKPPRYYDRLYDLEEPEMMAEIKEKRKRLADEARKLKLSNTSRTFEELLEVEESNLKARLAALKKGRTKL